MRNLLAVVLFSLATIAFFAGFSNFGIPQIEPAPPPEAEILDLEAMTMVQFVALGERLFEGKGTCMLCHNPVGARAPLLDRVGETSAQRIVDRDYVGKATDAESYISESMVEPSAYVVPGFGKAGSDNTVSPMPNVTAGSIGLSEPEIRAVIAFLQDSSGVEVTVEIPTVAAEELEPERRAAGEARPLLETPEAAIVELGCGACHVVAGEEGELGPGLTEIGARRDKAYLRRSILAPNAEIAEGFEPDIMPDDYGEQLYAIELEMLVEYLAGLK